MRALEKEGVDMQSELMGWVVSLSLRFRVEKDILLLKTLKASFLCLKNMAMMATICVQLRLVGMMQIWWEFCPVSKPMKGQ
jgi:hypothetical protein